MKLFVKVTPKAKRNVIEQIDETHFKVWVTAVPERGKANEAVIKLLAKHLHLPKSLLELTAGSTGRNKIIIIH